MLLTLVDLLTAHRKLEIQAKRIFLRRNIRNFRFFHLFKTFKEFQSKCVLAAEKLKNLRTAWILGVPEWHITERLDSKSVV